MGFGAGNEPLWLPDNGWRLKKSKKSRRYNAISDTREKRPKMPCKSPCMRWKDPAKNVSAPMVICPNSD